MGLRIMKDWKNIIKNRQKTYLNISLDTKIWHKVELDILGKYYKTDEIKKWLDEKQFHCVINDTDYNSIEYWFTNEEHALEFKLRWI